MTEPDWLAIPEEDKAAEKIADPAAHEREQIRDTLAAPSISSRALVAAESEASERRAFVNAWGKLTFRQRAYLRAMQKNGFRHPVSVNLANAVTSPAAGRRIGWHTPSRWMKQDNNYRIVLAALKADAVAQVASREDLLLRAHRIAEAAEDGEPVFGVDREGGGHKVIGHEKKLDTALRANEQIAKITKVLGGEERGNGGAVGPALVIQVVQRDGALVDVTPKGVTIDLPRPRGD